MARTQIPGTQIADGANGVNLTVDVTGILPAANGGHGGLTGITKANGASPPTAATAGTDYVSPSSAETLTNKTLSGSNNTLSNVSADSTIDGTTNKVLSAFNKAKLTKTPPLPAASEVEATTALGVVSVVSGGFATTIASGVQAALMGSTTGLFGITGAVGSNMVNIVNSYYGACWKDDANTGAVGTISTAPFSVNQWVSDSRYVEYLLARYDYSALVQGAYRVWIDGHKVTDLPVVSGMPTTGNPFSLKIDLGDTKPHLVRLDCSGIVLNSVYTEPAGCVWAANPGPRLFVLGCSLTGGMGTTQNTGYELGTWLHRFANMVGITDYWNGGEAGTGPNVTAASGNWKNYKTRATTQAIPAAADVYVIDSYVNDFASRTGAQIVADVATTISTIKAGVPNARFIVLGGFDSTGTSNISSMTTIDTTQLEPVCATAGAAFISPITGRVVGFDGTLLATTGKWITTANLATYISGDNTHPTDAGHQYIAYLMRNAWASIWGLPDSMGIGPAPVLPGISNASWAPGKLVYDKDNECLTFFNNDANVSMQVGQELWSRVRNVTGSTIANGTPVYVVGVDSGLPTIAPARANALATTTPVGLATESIATGTTGFVASMGAVRGLNTAAYSAGQAVYLDAASAGALTATPPASPNYQYRVGKVVTVDSVNGIIHVMPSAAIAPAGWDALSNGNTSRQSQVVVSGTSYYITGSNLALPNPMLTGLVVGSRFRWRVAMDKTAAGTGAFAIEIRRGTAGTVADTADVSQSIGTQTAVVDSMVVDVEMVITATGATGSYYWTITPVAKAATATGFGVPVGPTGFFSGTVASVNLTTAGLVFGLSFKATTGTPTITVPLVQASAIKVV